MSNKTVSVLEIQTKHKIIPEYMEYIDHVERFGIPFVYEGTLHEPCSETYTIHRFPVKEIFRNDEVESYYVATPSVQEIIDCDVESQVENLKADYERKEKVLKNKEELVDFELEQSRNQMDKLRKNFHKREQSWTKESFIGHVICFILGCAVTTGMILGG